VTPLPRDLIRAFLHFDSNSRLVRNR
jgi:hypothetical protein